MKNEEGTENPNPLNGNGKVNIIQIGQCYQGKTTFTNDQIQDLLQDNTITFFDLPEMAMLQKKIIGGR